MTKVNPIWIWSANFIAAGIVLIWLFVDSRFEASVQWWRFEHATSNSQYQIRDMGDWWWLSWRNRTAMILMTFATISILVMVIGLWFGRTKSRSLIAWFALTSIIALWMGLATNWQDIAWLGKQYRLRTVLSQFDQVVTNLHQNWPDRDGKQDIIGPFMAYPVSDPATLILLTLPKFKNTTTSFAVVEGGGDVLRFELVGAERGDWVEWHPDRSGPTDFISGLGEDYRAERYQKLGGHWYLVRYKN